MKQKKEKEALLRMLLGTLGANLLESMLTGKSVLSNGYGNNEGKGILRAGYGSKGSSIRDYRFKKIFQFHLIF